MPEETAITRAQLFELETRLRHTLAPPVRPLGVTEEQIERWFTYHPPANASEIAAYTAIRDGARTFARVLAANTPPSADQTVALRKLREAVATANAAIACGGK